MFTSLRFFLPRGRKVGIYRSKEKKTGVDYLDDQDEKILLRYDDICTVRHKSRFSWKILMFACNFPCFMLLRKTNVSRIFNICAI